jgi:hypothetical protein
VLVALVIFMLVALVRQEQEQVLVEAVEGQDSLALELIQPAMLEATEVPVEAVAAVLLR